MEGKEVKSDNFTWKITQPVNCETENCVYVIEGNKEKCKQRYPKTCLIHTTKKLTECLKRLYLVRNSKVDLSK